MMIRNIKYLSLGLIFLLGYRFFTYPKFKNIKLELKEKYSDYSIGNDKDKLTYQIAVENEKKNGIIYPPVEPYSAKIYGKLLSIDENLNLIQTKLLTEILNDSSSYRWGEIGTFEHYKTIIFYDIDNNVIGITEIDSDLKQTYSTPSNKTMKWGNLSDKGERKLKEILM
ncbi:MAG: hypothetical protein QM499_06810 [Flavobacteriaceae bacterium]